jgi:hypothetical protein
MKDMKKRIVALILTIVMSLLALSSCAPAFDFVEEDLNSYADFKFEEFKAALEKLEIEDGEFTTDSETREKIVAATIYNAIADKIIASTKEDDRVTEGTLSAGAFSPEAAFTAKALRSFGTFPICPASRS